ncbi:MAG: sigma-70 family RNA polymerase sigma factor [Pseudomonadota bacterium]
MAVTFFKTGKHARRRRLEKYAQAALPELYRTALALTRQQDDAEDLVQDACVRALAASDQAPVDQQSSCYAWMRTILINIFRDRYRRERRSPVVSMNEDFDNVIDFAISDRSTPEKIRNKKLFEESLHRALLELTPDARTMIVLHAQSGLGYKDIADITNVPIGTVMSRIARARKTLREKMRHALPEFKEAINE